MHQCWGYLCPHNLSTKNKGDWGGTLPKQGTYNEDSDKGDNEYIVGELLEKQKTREKYK